MHEALTRVTIERMGRRGEGIAETNTGRIYVPYALPGETAHVDRQGERGTLVGLIEKSADRIEPVCPYFTTCGGCAVQAWAPAPYAAWKRSLLVEALIHAGVAADVGSLFDAHGAGRRRATFHSRVAVDGRARVGFMQARAHTIVPIEACPILDPRLDGALAAAQAVAQALAASDKPLDIVVTATETGLDIDLRGQGALSDAARSRLVEIATAHDLARLSNHGVIVLETRKPILTIGAARVAPPPGVFLQATEGGEAALGTKVLDGLKGASKVADLFAGLGTFALLAAEQADVAAFDNEAPALAALDRAARATAGLHHISCEKRDLFSRPLTPDELNAYDAVVLDPPRAGAEAQATAIAASKITRVVSVACDARTFARDAAILVGAGFEIGAVVPIDQFRYSAHLEMIATFRRAAPKRKRRLLG